MSLSYSSEERRRETIKRMNDPNTADNMDVRGAIIDRIKAGEITLEEGQKELRAIQRKARKEGRPTAYGTQSWVKETNQTKKKDT